MTKLYLGEILIAATVYVVADSEDEAKVQIAKLQDEQTGIEFSSRSQEVAEGLVVTGESYSEDMPALSLSPAMTIQKSVTLPQVWLLEDLEEGSPHE